MAIFPTIHIENLSIGYIGKKKVKVVATDISADIYGGELTCLLGANGVGKSTLLRTLSAFQPKLGGKILINEKDIDSYTDKELARVVSVVLTERSDLQNITAEELVGLGRTPYTGFFGNLTEEDKSIVHRSMELVGVAHLADRMMHKLSDGQRQKVMIAKALAQDTSIICLDEPTAFLDYPSKVDMLLLLHRLSRETGKTIFLSTHDLELAMQVADKLWLMDREKGVLIGTPEALSVDGSIGNTFKHESLRYDSVQRLFRVIRP